jgi:hypothetical protein
MSELMIWDGEAWNLSETSMNTEKGNGVEGEM